MLCFGFICTVKPEKPIETGMYEICAIHTNGQAESIMYEQLTLVKPRIRDGILFVYFPAERGYPKPYGIAENIKSFTLNKVE